MQTLSVMLGYERGDMEIVDAHISTITAGDTVVHDGHLRTVCENDVRYDDFIWHTLFGDSYGANTILIMKVLWKAEQKRSTH